MDLERIGLKLIRKSEMEEFTLYRKNSYSVLSKMKTLKRTMFEELKYEDDYYELWVSILTAGDGARFNHEVTLKQKKKDGTSEVVLSYEPEM